MMKVILVCLGMTWWWKDWWQNLNVPLHVTAIWLQFSGIKVASECSFTVFLCIISGVKSPRSHLWTNWRKNVSYSLKRKMLLFLCSLSSISLHKPAFTSTLLLNLTVLHVWAEFYQFLLFCRSELGFPSNCGCDCRFRGQTWRCWMTWFVFWHDTRGKLVMTAETDSSAGFTAVCVDMFWPLKCWVSFKKKKSLILKEAPASRSVCAVFTP